MITTTENIEIEQINDGAEIVQGEFTIKATAKSFNILISNVYSDKVGAMLRELSANALDAHIENKCADKPFNVHTPNGFEPWFSVRDFGVSMSHEFMLTKYTQAFYSSKSESNELIGAMGMGRLVGLAMTDNYVATCYQNGKKRQYQVFKGSNGIPQISFIGESESSEPKGFEIKVSVPSQYHHEFAEKAAKIYRFFNPRPVISGARITIEDKEPIISGADWKVFQSGYYTSGLTAIMGCYSYPIDNSVIRYNQNLTNAGKALLNTDIQVNFKIGDLDVNAGREGLSYDERTINNIVNKLNSVVEEIKAEITKKFADCKSVYEVHKLYSELGNTSIKFLIDNVFGASSIDFQGKKVNLNYIQKGSFDIHFHQTYFRSVTKVKQYASNYLNYNSNFIYVIKDCEPANLSNKIRTLLPNGYGSGKEVLLISGDISLIKKWAAEYGFDSYPVQYLSQIADTKLARVKSETIKCYKYDNAKSYYSAMQPAQIDIANDAGYYVIMQSRRKGDYGIKPDANSTISDYNFREMADNLKLVGISLPNDIYGIYTKPAFKRLSKNPNMESLFDYLFDQVESLILAKKDVQEFVDYKHYNNDSYNISRAVKFLKTHAAKNKAAKEIIDNAAKMSKYSAKVDLAEIMNKLSSLTGRSFSKLPAPSFDFSVAIDSFWSKHPLTAFYHRAIERAYELKDKKIEAMVEKEIG